VKYSFCEGVWATARSPWHIRRIGKDGAKHYGGGIDTASLCGRVVEGWDLEVEITRHHLSHACPACVAKYTEEVKP
jgi:hypothetical protein